MNLGFHNFPLITDEREEKKNSERKSLGTWKNENILMFNPL